MNNQAIRSFLSGLSNGSNVSEDRSISLVCQSLVEAWQRRLWSSIVRQIVPDILHTLLEITQQTCMIEAATNCN